jgi:hypothetical protein
VRVDDVFRTEFVEALVKIQTEARLMPGVVVMNGEPLAIDNERRAAERFYDQWVAPIVAEKEILRTRLIEADQILSTMRLDLD